MPARAPEGGRRQGFPAGGRPQGRVRPRGAGCFAPCPPWPYLSFPKTYRFERASRSLPDAPLRSLFCRPFHPPLFQKIPPPFPASRPAGQTGHFKAIRRLPLSPCIKPHGKRGRRSFGSREALHFEKSQVQAFLACFFTSLLFLLKKAFTISTMGMMASASSTATAYSSRLTVSNWKARASGGI